MRTIAVRPIFSRDFVVACRLYLLDVCSSIFLFFGVAITAGRVWRFPFEDEIFTIVPGVPAAAERSTLEFLRFYLDGGDIHPPLTFLFFSRLHYLGVSAPTMRLCSLALTAASLALFQLLTLSLLHRRNGGCVSFATRWIAILLFGLSPLALCQGDAIRWYPQFAACFALFLTLYVSAGNVVIRLASAIPLGIAASINLITPIVVIPFVVYRYFLQREQRLSFDISYWTLFVAFGCLGIYTAVSLMRHGFPELLVATGLFGRSIFSAAAIDILGVFGGNSIGVGYAWVILPVAAICLLAMLGEIDLENPADPIHLFLLMFGGIALAAIVGFAEPRSFLYLAPVEAAILTVFLDRQKDSRRALLLATLIILPTATAIANIDNSTHPFKREAAAPFAEIVDFIKTNETGGSLVVSTDPVVLWLLQHDPHRCLSYFMSEESCFLAPERYDSIFIVSGHSDNSPDAESVQHFEDMLASILAGRHKAAEIHVGLDKDAEIKSRLTGVPLSKFILTIALYR
jgi:hypothetical protein